MKRTMIYLTLFLLVTSAGAIDFRDDFEDGNMDEWTEQGPCKWQIENGELILQPVSFQCGFTIGEATWQDYTVGAKVKIVEHQANPQRGEGAVLLLRFTPTFRFYWVALRTPPGSDLKIASSAYSDDTLTNTVLKAEPFDWELNRWYDLQVRAKGSHFELFIDGKVVLSHTSNVYPMGAVGLGIGNEFTSAHFDDFFVTDEDIPSITAVSPKTKVATTWSEIKRRQ